MPGISYPDVRLMTPNLGGLVPAAREGVGLAQILAQIGEEARQRPLRQRLAEIQLAEAENRLQMAPIQLAQLQQDAAIPKEIVEGVRLAGGEQALRAVNPEADFANFQIEKAYTPLEEIVTGQRIGAGGVITPFEKRVTKKTGAMVAAEADKRAMDRARQDAAIKASDALASQRERGKEFESEALIQGLQNAEAEGDEDTAALYRQLLGRKTAMPGTLTPGTTYARRLELLAADAGLTLPQAQSLAQSQQGLSVIQKLVAKNRAARSGDTFGGSLNPGLKITPQEKALLDASNAVAPDAVGANTGAFDPKSVLREAMGEGAPAYKSADDVKAAFRAGKISRTDAEKVLQQQFGFPK